MNETRDGFNVPGGGGTGGLGGPGGESFKKFLTFPNKNEPHVLILQHIGDGITTLAIIVNILGIFVINSSCKKLNKLSNSKLLLMYMSLTIIAQSMFKFAMLYAKLPITKKLYLFIFFAMFLILRRLSVIIMSIDQISIIVLGVKYKTIMTKKVIFWMLLTTYILGIEFVVLRIIFIKNFRCSRIVTSTNLFTADAFFILFAILTFASLKRWNSNRSGITKNARAKDAVIAILCILATQTVLSIIPDIIGSTALFQGENQAIWKSINHICSGISALCDPLLYILVVKNHRQIAKKMIQRRTLFLKNQNTVSPENS
eukprot:TCONS_00059920-protein